MNRVLISILLIILLLLASCDTIKGLAKKRYEVSSVEDDSPPAVATDISPFVSVKKHYVMTAGSRTDISFSLYVAEGDVLGYVKLSSPDNTNSIKCKGPEDTLFSISATPTDLNPIDNEVVTLTATLSTTQQPQLGEYTCPIYLFDDLEIKQYTSSVSIYVVAQT